LNKRSSGQHAGPTRDCGSKKSSPRHENQPKSRSFDPQLWPGNRSWLVPS